MKLFGSRKPTVPARRLADRQPRPEEYVPQQFRRNQTMSGVRRETLAEAASPRSKVHHLTRQRRKVGGILLIVLIAIGVLALLLTQMTAKVLITSSTTSLNSSIDGEKYEKIINDYLGIHPAARLRFLLNEQELSDYVSAIAPEVARVQQTGAHNIVETRFAMTFRQPLAGWQINSRQYYVDDQGVVFEKNYFQPPNVQIIDESGISPEQGSTVASARFLSFVGRVVGLSKDSGYEVVEAILPSGTTRLLEIRLKDVGSLIKLSIDRGAGEQVEDMTRALRYLQSRGESPSYIDVRIGGRAVYQ
ncbi:MAG: hypothetical protein WAV04_02240 [Candidatus Microsaccharimonas sp.]